MMNYSTFPNQYMVGGLQRYFEHGIEPGSYMSAVLRNDLKTACMKADDENRRLIFETVKWLYNEAPYGSWGNPNAFHDMINYGGYQGMIEGRSKELAEDQS